MPACHPVFIGDTEGRVAGEGDPLFAVSDAAGRDRGTLGLVRGSVAGSYAHIIA